MLQNMCDEGGVQGKKTNHSLRAYAATELFQADVSEKVIRIRIVDIVPWKAYANMSAYLRSRSEMLVECSHLMQKKSKQVWKIVHLQCSKMSC